MITIGKYQLYFQIYVQIDKLEVFWSHMFSKVSIEIQFTKFTIQSHCERNVNTLQDCICVADMVLIQVS